MQDRGDAGDFQVVVLGSGTCVPSGARNSAGYWVDGPGFSIRLDCGAGTVHAMHRYGLPWEDLGHQFISHFHIDHVGELPALLFAFKYGRSRLRQQPLSLIGPRGLRRLLRRFGKDYRMELLEQEFEVRLVELEPDESVALGSEASLSVASTPHTEESLAVRIDCGGASIGYTGDTGPSVELARFFTGVDALIAECSFVDDARGTRHLLASEAAELAARAGAGHLVATHCYYDPDAAQLGALLRQHFDGRISIATDGLRFGVR
jgi:ribonuclease BN (tRNA processing enzyme)